MKFKFNLRREIKIGAIIIVLLFLIGFTERQQEGAGIQEIQVKIENVENNHFVDEEDIIGLMQINKEALKGASLSKLSMKEIERRIKKDRFVKETQLYSDIKGNLVVKVELRKPIARIVRNDGPDGYIAEDGTVMPVSEKFSTRVVLLSGLYAQSFLQQENLNTTEGGKQLMNMINLIIEDDFWKAQVAQLDTDRKGRITIFPQVGDEMVEFGTAENAEAKFKKLKIFYKEILPVKGWSKYKRVNLEYEGQIIAE